MKIIFLLILIIFSNGLCSQIKVRENIKTEAINYSMPNTYDSIFDFRKQNKNIDYLKFVGQDLFLPPLKDKASLGLVIDIPRVYKLQTTKETEYIADTIFVNKILIGHANGYYDKLAENMRLNINQRKIKTNIYKPHISLEIGNPEIKTIIRLGRNAFNKSYKIINITTEKNKDLREITGELKQVRVWLQTDTNDTIYFDKELMYGAKSFDPFIVKGFYEFHLKNYIGKKLFVYKEVELNGDNIPIKPHIDINTGEVVSISAGEMWLCDEISFLKLPYHETLRPYYILSKDNNEIKVELGTLIENGFLTLEELQNLYNIYQEEIKDNEKQSIERLKELQKECGKDYSKEICEKLIHGKIDIGMTKNMVLFSLGSPFKSYILKRKTGLKEVYSYGGTILYFNNGILEMIEQYK